ncbi:LruC domain-containing protein [Hufsiella ginkgonis]|uniref:LruC domain-containing protein n=1 Tax=Hufsiella ginkgonis TaxID=2695274 RepID=A0A7K1XZD6_9SPHI|nr:LruC domain-containing protein [Hufsiella ginkgonis]MXV16168.1 LruC domain-containing protein [Hufsiella ginkgonis]
MKQPILWTLLIATLAVVSCSKEATDEVVDPTAKTIANGFNFSTTKSVELNLRLLTNTNAPMKGVVVSVLKPGTTEKDGVLFKAASDANGYIKGSMTVPSYLDTLMITPNYPGLINNAKVLISGSTLTATLGGVNGASSNVIPEPVGVKKRSTGSKFLADPNYVYPAPYTNSQDAVRTDGNYRQYMGVPKFMLPQADPIPQSLLNYIDASLPEQVAVATHHASYLADQAISVLRVTQAADIWVTFVSEGASYQNSLGYYTYPTNNPPQTKDDIGTVTMVFPNASAHDSKGELFPGDKIKLGTFNAGTSIAFVLIQDAWVSFGEYWGVETSRLNFFTHNALNPEVGTSAPDYFKRHSVLLNDNVHNLFLVGFEDIQRQFANGSLNNGCDNDFNDLVFYATSNPLNSIDPDHVEDVDKGGDDDGDGIPVPADEYPGDPNRAYNETMYWNTLLFEDQWPLKGDYDLNDVVIQYRYTYVKNAANQVVDLKCEYKTLAAGANFKNGFGVEFPFASSLVASVTGQRSVSGYITYAGNGLEAGQVNATIIPFDNQNAVIGNAGAGQVINTEMSQPKVEGDQVTVLMTFTSPVSRATIGDGPFNPFLISNMQRGAEVHLPGHLPTSKANLGLLGTADDASVQGTPSTYYLSSGKWPWAIHIAGSFTYMTERSAIQTGYLHFLDWAASSGALFEDWWSNTGSGYRETQFLYTK